ncbi:heat-inducible transcription repressor HrcA [Methylomagnum ishizawai]|uniref:Heat-inducible transcription repressor HrcA n=1 Tax=Methylomagnum ishizawai TaxID=1760988 RepID=A0A1Y6D0R1_9GAMM|nr:heat-inducible transcriptional repressor HrcA [Methylomagnum ishizawai]SMF96237.1 heat-inducible transcription repressor HrcA [Methylomagnum ishizawai]
MSNPPQLSERAQHLLKVLVERYINDGEPVGSRALAREAGLNLSPATIRNVMADLEELGLITAPHTSAGRMPTVTGYRFFIDTLLTVKPLQQDLVRQITHNLDNHQDTPDDLLETASRLLSEVSHMAGVVTLPRRESVTFRHIEFLPLSEQRILVILVTNEQEVHNQIIHAPRQFSPADLQTAANYLNSLYAGKDLALVRETLFQDMMETRHQLGQEIRAAAAIAGLALQPNDHRRKPFVLTGEINLMDFSELASTERLRGLFETFHQKEDMVGLLDRCIESPGVKIFIGEESGHRALDQCSLVTASYSINDHAVGVLGVIGPTRMGYERVIPLVDLTAKLVGAALNHKSLSPS